MRASKAIAAGLLIVLHATAASAQMSTGISGGGAAGGVGSSGIGTTGSGIGSTGTDLGIGGSVGTGDIGSTGAATGNPNATVTEPILPDADQGLGGGSDSNAARATRGDSTINSLNVDGLARSGTGTGGSAVTSTLGEVEGGYEPTAGSGSSQLYRIPTPTVDVDLGAIRRGLASAPSATPKPNGD
ncbi:MAG TPA: hypothetical protein VGO17_02465 [Aurantimonas sp.]|jgi:hypothetical protein|nr:hypothetical protein [Aurantimonas sp.]